MKGFFIFVVATCGLLAAIFWPTIEEFLFPPGSGCPWPFNYFHTNTPLPTYTLEELATYDGRDSDKPLLLAVDGKVLNVTSGERFYGSGKSYNMFAGKVRRSHNFDCPNLFLM